MNQHNDSSGTGAFAWRTLIVLLGTAAALAVSDARSQEAGDHFDRIWSIAELYSGTSDSALKSVALSGRFQVDQANVDAEGEDFSELDLRRLRFGIKLNFNSGVKIHAEADFDPQGGNLGYKKLTDAYVSYSPGDAVELTVGKQSVGFTMDGQTSSKELLTIDRSALSNNIWFTDEYIPGVSVNGEKGAFVYNFGIFSSGPKNRGFGGSSGGEFVLATIGRDFSKQLRAKQALLRLNMVDNEPDPRNGFTRPLEQVLSLNFAFERDGWGVRSDVSTATGYLGQSDLSGFMVMPFFNLNKDLQLVTRYTYVSSDDPNGVRFGRYESSVVSGRGDRYSEIYLGLNYYLYGHKFKVQTGLQYADMDDVAADGGAYSGWGWTTGLRISW
jgi:phosphate-selective porin OprO/OprP